MSLLTDPGYIVHHLRLSNLRLDDRVSDKVITFTPLQNEYIKLGPVNEQKMYCYSPNVNHDYLMLNANSILMNSADNLYSAQDTSSANANVADRGGGGGGRFGLGPGAGGPLKSSSTYFGGRGKYDRRRMVAAQAAATASARGLGGTGGGNGAVVVGAGEDDDAPFVPAGPIPAFGAMAMASLESDDDIDVEEDEQLKSPQRMFPKMAIAAQAGAAGGTGGAPGIFITTPSRPGSANNAEKGVRVANMPPPIDTTTPPQQPTSPTTAGNDTEQEPSSARDMDLGDVTLDSIQSPLDLSPPEPYSGGGFMSQRVSMRPTEIDVVSANNNNDNNNTNNALSSMIRPPPNTPPPNRTPMPPIDVITNGILESVNPAPVSLLTASIQKQKTKEDNPFAEEFLRVAGIGEPSPVQLKIYVPSSDKPKDPMKIVVKRDATVEEVIGYILYQYYNESRTPLLSEEMSTVVQWTIRIVEDDGEIDDDLPAVERTLKIGKFSTNQHFAMNQFALCEATPAQVQINENLYVKAGKSLAKPKKQATFSSSASLAPGGGGSGGASSVAGGASGHGEGPMADSYANSHSAASGSTAVGTVGGAQGRSMNPLMGSSHYVRVRLHTNHEVKHTTTVEILPKMVVSDIIEYICQKRKMNPEEWLLKVAETNVILPKDGAAEDISQSTELALVSKASELSTGLQKSRARAGFGDLSSMGMSYLTSNEAYREYTLNRKRRGGYVGRHDQVLAIDFEYIRIMPSSTRTLLFDSGKTSSYHISAVLTCKQRRKAPSHLKLIVMRDRERKVYEFEAASIQQSQEICQKITQMKNKST